MDVLKKAYANLEECVVDKNIVIVQGKHHDAQQTIMFPTKKSKEYTLGSVVFFLLNSKKSIKDYMSLCKQNDIVAISYVDKAGILSDIEQYEPISIKGFFLEPKYEINKKYDVPNIKTKDVILVPCNLISKIHIKTVEKLLIDGKFESTTSNPFAQNNVNININGRNYIIANDIENFTKDDWNRVCAVFIENSSTPETKNILFNCPKDVVVFTLEHEPFKSVKLEISGGVLKNHKQVLDYFK